MPNLQHPLDPGVGMRVERRTSTRFAMEVPVEIRLAPPAGRDTAAYSLRNPFRRATIKDISTGGIYVTSGIRVPEGSMIDLRLTHDGRVYQFKAVVRHTEVDALSTRSTMGLGAQIVRSDVSDAVLALLIAEAMRCAGLR